MKKLPQRPRSHVLETESMQFVQKSFPKEWIIEKGQSDYGVDLIIEIVEDDSVTGAHFLIQLKSTDNLVINKKGFVSHSCNTKTLQYFLERTEPVIYLVYDAKKQIGYWIWIKDYLMNQPSSDWKIQDNFVIKIPRDNFLNKEAIENIKLRVLKLHQKEKINSRIQSIDHPLYNFNLYMDETSTTVNVLPKFPGTNKDIPLSVGLKLNFGNTDEGKKALRNWEDVFKKGEKAIINAKFIEKIKFDKNLSPEILFGDDFELEEMEVEPIKRNIKLPTRIEVLSDDDQVLAQVPYIEFEEVRRGSEETLFSNEKQELFLDFFLLFNSLENKVKFSCKSKSQSTKVFEMHEALTFQKKIAEGNWLQIIDIKTNKRIIRFPVFQKSVYIPSETKVRFVDYLLLLQEKFNVSFDFVYDKVTQEDYDLVNKAVNIINTGYSLENTKFGFEFDKNVAKEIASRYNLNKLELLVFDSPDRTLELFNQKLNFGPIKIYLPNPKPTEKTIEKFMLLDKESDNKKVRVNLDVDEPGFFIQYLDWLPKTKNGE